MYNLIITGKKGVWDEQGYEIPRERLGEYTSVAVKEKLQNFNQESFEVLQSLPTLFGYEGDEDSYRVGYLTQIKERWEMIYIKYVFDSRIPEIPVTEIHSLQSKLDIKTNNRNSFGEFSRTHWAVKDEDLIKILYESKIIDERSYDALRLYPGVDNIRITYTDFADLKKYTHLVKFDNFRYKDVILNDKYRLEEFIGSGGIGMVYLATDLQPSAINRIVAVKLIQPAVVNRNPDYVKLFENEFLAASKLDHPNVVKIFDSGTDEPTKSTYAVMELIDGESLDRILINQKLSLEMIQDIFRQVCEAVQHSHSKNVLHLDLKPENILLIKNDHERFLVKIIDFGMSKIISSESGTTVTRFGGTPQFCSPEHFVGRKQTKLSDVYSLGAILYNMITGVMPFGAPSYFNAKQHSQLEMPPTPSIASQRPDVPIELDAVIEKAISKNPAMRQQSVGELLQDFQRALKLIFIDTKDMWEPKTESEIMKALSNGSLEESATFEAKSELPGKNVELAKDVSAFANAGGGTIVYGIREDSNKRLTKATPVTLKDQRERIDIILQNNVSEIPKYKISAIETAADPTKGFIILSIDPSERAPHMVDVKNEKRYYGRGETGNRLLSESEVARLYERRRLTEVNTGVLLDDLIGRYPLEDANESVQLHILVKPVITSDTFLENLQTLFSLKSGYDYTVPKILDLSIQSALSPHLFYNDDYHYGLSTPRWIYRIDGYFADVFRHGYSQTSKSDEALFLEAKNDGSGTLTCGWSGLTFHNNLGEATKYFYRLRTAVLTARFLAFWGDVYQKAEYFGRVDVGIAVTNLQGSIDSEMPTYDIRPDNKFYTSDYKQIARVSAEELKDNPKKLTEKLLDRLFKSIAPNRRTVFKDGDWTI